MHARHMVAHLGAQVALLLVAAALLALLGPDTSQADDKVDVERALLVKCSSSEVPKVLAALGPLKARVYDIKTMKSIHMPGCPAAVIPLPDAVQAMAALREALATVKKDGAPAAHLADLQVTARRLRAGIELSDPALADGMPKALGEARYFAARNTQIQVGAMSRRDGRWKLQLTLNLGDPSREAKPLTKRFDHLPTLELHRIEVASDLARMYMGATKIGYDQRRNVRTISRSVTYQDGATLARLTGFLASIGRETPLTVTELRWKLEDSGLLGKVVMQVSLQTPLLR